MGRMFPIEQLKTGDIILFNEHPYSGCMVCIDWAIRCWTHSVYSHVGLIVVDPPWTKKGTYVWDSSRHVHKDPEDDKIKYGIALIPLQNYIDYDGGRQKLYKRSPLNKDVYKRFTNDALTELHNKVYGCHYDTTIGHWLAAMVHILIPRSTKTFFCSAFVSYTLTQLGILDQQTDWTIVSPADLSEHGTLDWEYKYGPDILISEH